MDTATLLLAVAIAGVNFGWQKADDGSTGYDYTVQIEPELVDVLMRGEPVPIESTIPPEVTPLRKVRIVVGRGELPREPLRHTANFAGQGGWTPDRYSTPPASDANSNRYGMTGAGGVAPPPSVMDRAQTAVTESATAISDGVQAGVRATSDQLSRTGSQMMGQTRNSAQDFGQQLQQWTDDAGRQMQSAGNGLQSASQQTLDATGNQLRQAGNALGLPPSGTASNSRGGVTAPPWPQAPSAAMPSEWPAGNTPAGSTFAHPTVAPGMAVTRTPTGWTSIGSNVAAPPLLNPPMATSPISNSQVRIASGNGAGPTFPMSPPPAGREPLHSVLVDPSRQPAAAGTGTNPAANGWDDNWGTSGRAAQASIGRNADPSTTGAAADNFGMVPVRPVAPTAQNTQQAANRWSDPWVEPDPWEQTAQGTSTQSMAVTGAPPHSSSPQAAPPQNPNLQTSNRNGSGFANSGQNGAAPQYPNSPLIGQAPATSGGMLNAGTATPPADPTVATQQVPWLPLLLVSLSLVGSLSANLFLGWSYMDARQKYRSLVRKTAETFRRAASAAAA